MSLWRKNPKRDGSEPGIVRSLTALGCAVHPMSGTGAPDLLVARGDRMILLECKAPAGPRGGVSGRGLTDAQKLWHAKWPTKIHIARTTDDAIAVAVREFGIQGNLVPVATAWDDDIDVGGKPYEPEG